MSETTGAERNPIDPDAGELRVLIAIESMVHDNRTEEEIVAAVREMTIEADRAA